MVSQVQTCGAVWKNSLIKLQDLSRSLPTISTIGPAESATAAQEASSTGPGGSISHADVDLSIQRVVQYFNSFDKPACPPDVTISIAKEVELTTSLVRIWVWISSALLNAGHGHAAKLITIAALSLKPVTVMNNAFLSELRADKRQQPILSFLSAIMKPLLTLAARLDKVQERLPDINNLEGTILKVMEALLSFIKVFHKTDFVLRVLSMYEPLSETMLGFTAICNTATRQIIKASCGPVPGLLTNLLEMYGVANFRNTESPNVILRSTLQAVGLVLQTVVYPIHDCQLGLLAHRRERDGQPRQNGLQVVQVALSQMKGEDLFCFVRCAASGLEAVVRAVQAVQRVVMSPVGPAVMSPSLQLDAVWDQAQLLMTYALDVVGCELAAPLLAPAPAVNAAEEKPLSEKLYQQQELVKKLHELALDCLDIRVIPPMKHSEEHLGIQHRAARLILEIHGCRGQPGAGPRPATRPCDLPIRRSSVESALRRGPATAAVATHGKVETYSALIQIASGAMPGGQAGWCEDEERRGSGQDAGGKDGAQGSRRKREPWSRDLCRLHSMLASARVASFSLLSQGPAAEAVVAVRTGLLLLLVSSMSPRASAGTVQASAGRAGGLTIPESRASEPSSQAPPLISSSIAAALAMQLMPPFCISTENSLMSALQEVVASAKVLPDPAKFLRAGGRTISKESHDVIKKSKERLDRACRAIGDVARTALGCIALLCRGPTQALRNMPRERSTCKGSCAVPAGLGAGSGLGARAREGAQHRSRPLAVLLAMQAAGVPRLLRQIASCIRQLSSGRLWTADETMTHSVLVGIRMECSKAVDALVNPAVVCLDALLQLGTAAAAEARDAAAASVSAGDSDGSVAVVATCAAWCASFMDSGLFSNVMEHLQSPMAGGSTDAENLGEREALLCTRSMLPPLPLILARLLSSLVSCAGSLSAVALVPLRALARGDGRSCSVLAGSAHDQTNLEDTLALLESRACEAAASVAQLAVLRPLAVAAAANSSSGRMISRMMEQPQVRSMLKEFKHGSEELPPDELAKVVVAVGGENALGMANEDAPKVDAEPSPEAVAAVERADRVFKVVLLLSNISGDLQEAVERSLQLGSGERGATVGTSPASVELKAAGSDWSVLMPQLSGFGDEKRQVAQCCNMECQGEGASEFGGCGAKGRRTGEVVGGCFCKGECGAWYCCQACKKKGGKSHIFETCQIIMGRRRG